MKVIYLIVLSLLVIALFLGLFRSIKGPRRADRIVGVNMIGSTSTLILALLAVYLEEAWLLDVCLVYGLVSFLTIVFLTKISIIERGKEND